MEEKTYPAFGDIRKLVSRIDRVSMLLDDSSYENFATIGDVPPSYDQMVVKGIGIIDSEFPAAGDLHPTEAHENAIGKGVFLGRCIEFWVSQPGPSVRSVDSKLRSAAAELECAMSGLGGEARERAMRASEGIAGPLENLGDAMGRESEEGATGPLSSALAHMESAGDALLEACGAIPAGPAKPLD